MLCAPVGTRATSVMLAKLPCGYDCWSSSTTVVTAITTSRATPAATQASGRWYHGRAAACAGEPDGGATCGGTGGPGGAEVGGAETGAAPFGVSAADGAGGTTSASAPSATGSSGCSSTVGAMPRWECRSRATIGSRDEPPTRNSPANRSG